MADFTTWDRATLEQFARAATDKLVANRAAIAELVAALQAAVDCGMVPVSSSHDGGANRYVLQLRVADQIRAAITKHSPTTTTKEETWHQSTK